MKGISMKISLSLKQSYFKQDFLDMEVRKKLAVRGDRLLCHFKEEYQEDAKQYGKLFSNDIMYYCKDYSSGKVHLIGIYT